MYYSFGYTEHVLEYFHVWYWDLCELQELILLVLECHAMLKYILSMVSYQKLCFEFLHFSDAHFNYTSSVLQVSCCTDSPNTRM